MLDTKLIYAYKIQKDLSQAKAPKWGRGSLRFWEVPRKRPEKAHQVWGNCKRFRFSEGPWLRRRIWISQEQDAGNKDAQRSGFWGKVPAKVPDKVAGGFWLLSEFYLHTALAVGDIDWDHLSFRSNFPKQRSTMLSLQNTSGYHCKMKACQWYQVNQGRPGAAGTWTQWTRFLNWAVSWCQLKLLTI